MNDCVRWRDLLLAEAAPAISIAQPQLLTNPKHQSVGRVGAPLVGMALMLRISSLPNRLDFSDQELEDSIDDIQENYAFTRIELSQETVVNADTHLNSWRRLNVHNLTRALPEWLTVYFSRALDDAVRIRDGGR